MNGGTATRSYHPLGLPPVLQTTHGKTTREYHLRYLVVLLTRFLLQGEIIRCIFSVLYWIFHTCVWFCPPLLKGALTKGPFKLQGALYAHTLTLIDLLLVNSFSLLFISLLAHSIWAFIFYTTLIADRGHAMPAQCNATKSGAANA